MKKHYYLVRIYDDNDCMAESSTNLANLFAAAAIYMEDSTLTSINIWEDGVEDNILSWSK